MREYWKWQDAEEHHSDNTPGCPNHSTRISLPEAHGSVLGKSSALKQVPPRAGFLHVYGKSLQYQEDPDSDTVQLEVWGKLVLKIAGSQKCIQKLELGKRKKVRGLGLEKTSRKKAYSSCFWGEEGDKNKGTTELHSKTGGWRAEKCSFTENRKIVMGWFLEC